MSGPFAVTAAARFPRMRAAAALYGVDMVTEKPDSPHRALDRIKGELYIGFAEIDPAVPANVVRRTGKRVESRRHTVSAGNLQGRPSRILLRRSTRLRSDRGRGKLGAHLRPLGTQPAVERDAIPDDPRRKIHFDVQAADVRRWLHIQRVARFRARLRHSDAADAGRRCGPSGADLGRPRLRADVQVLAPWKGTALRESAMRRVRDFLVANEPASAGASR